MTDPRRDEPGAPGDAELQTDVMRFFALLAICLVALMSLAREAPPPEPLPAAAARTPEPPVRAAPPDPPAAIPPPTPLPVPVPVPVPAREAPPEDPRLELRFASPAALARLEAAGKVEIYAVAGGLGYRWSRDAQRFVRHGLPEALYLMEPSTVPPGYKAALGTTVAGDARWGVTLSPAIRARLERAVGQAPPGLLLIDAAGNVAPAEGPG